MPAFPSALIEPIAPARLGPGFRWLFGAIAGAIVDRLDLRAILIWVDVRREAAAHA